MQAHILQAQLEGFHDFRVASRREISTLLTSVGEKKQLVRMLIDGQFDTCVTAILEVSSDRVFLDCSIDPQQNQLILANGGVAFETTLDNIRILFFSEQVVQCEHKERPALQIKLPSNLVRLQRREYYRMTMPLNDPVMVTVPSLPDMGDAINVFPLINISCGGVAFFDHQRLLRNTIGQNYAACLIELPNVDTVNVTLQIRTSQDLTLLNNKPNRMIGCSFVDMTQPIMASVQRYITKLERERNARSKGFG
jgi:c-di-GMP-binding flagellar brake protein YcgR